MNTKSYLFSLSYANRSKEQPFIIDILKQFDTNSLTGMVMLVNNNPYHFEFLLYLSFEKRDFDFDKWLAEKYPQKKFDYLFNYSADDIIQNMTKRSYNAYGFTFKEQAEEMLTGESNRIFIFPSEDIIAQKWGSTDRVFKYKVFLSHSSVDKPIIEEIFRELQKEEIKAFLDKYEIKPGDSIVEKLNDGLQNSDLGILLLSKNFLNSNWAKTEMSYFIHERMATGKKSFLIVNVNLTAAEIPPLLRDFRYISVSNPDWIQELIRAIRDLGK